MKTKVKHIFLVLAKRGEGAIRLAPTRGNSRRSVTFALIRVPSDQRIHQRLNHPLFPVPGTHHGHARVTVPTRLTDAWSGRRPSPTGDSGELSCARGESAKTFV